MRIPLATPVKIPPGTRGGDPRLVEGMWKGRPVVGSAVGGIQDQGTARRPVPAWALALARGIQHTVPSG